MGISRTLERALGKAPDRTAIVDGETRFTYRELAGRASGLARLAADAGVRRGDRIAILEENSHAFVEAYYAAAALGAILVPLNTRLTAADLAFILRDSGSRMLLAGPPFAKLAGDALALGTPVESVVPLPHEGGSAPFAPVAVDEDAPAHLYYTSGTTGVPKGVVLTHRNVCVHAQAAIEELGLAGTDAWGHIAPMFHLADAWATFAITQVAGLHVMVRRFDAGSVLDAVERHRVTISNLIPTMLTMLVNHPGAEDRDLSSLRVILSGGAPIAPGLVRRVMDTLGCDYIQTYGMTETSPYLTLSILEAPLEALPPEEQFRWKARTGRRFKAVELRVVDERGDDVPRDDRTVGEIRVRGATVTPGYWNRPDETAAAFKDGWLCTGDLAVIDAFGSVNIVDRRKDMILTGGENVYSTEIENALSMHPAVLEAAAFGAPDEKWGETVRAAVVLRSGQAATADEIIAFCRRHLAAYKAPRSIVFLEELPKTGSGKISKKLLRERHGA
ncbi:MAG: long-chain-fatty-acid--CoA ligase [Deltaproteobacteria bacterium]|nr:long-chain-fatty-acid--CoA ligase [Deltaproteobacteria bacterium]